MDLAFADVGGRTVLTRRRYRWPLLIGRVFPDPGLPGVGSVTIQNAAGTIIPGDFIAQRIEVIDGGSAVVRGQGATMVTGVPGGDVAIEETELRVDATSRLLLDAAPRILTPRARYRQRTRVCVMPGGRAVFVDAMVLHPELTDDLFGVYQSNVEIVGPTGAMVALDTQHLDAMPRVRRAPTSFATVYVIGTELDTAMTALTPELESLSVLTGDRRSYLGVSDLPNDAGWAVRIAASDGGVLRTTVGTVIAAVRLGSRFVWSG
jgi:urease accessory protein